MKRKKNKGTKKVNNKKKDLVFLKITKIGYLLIKLY